MTLQELAKVDREYLLPSEISKVLGCDQYSINCAARDGTLNLEYVKVGTRVRIAKRPFLKRMGYEPS